MWAANLLQAEVSASGTKVRLPVAIVTLCRRADVQIGSTPSEKGGGRERGGG